MINIEDINCFFNKNKRNKNDEFNKKREDIICKLFNDEITEEFLNKSRRWTLIKKNINEYTKKLHPNKIENIKCKKKQGEEITTILIYILIEKNIKLNLSIMSIK